MIIWNTKCYTCSHFIVDMPYKTAHCGKNHPENMTRKDSNCIDFKNKENNKQTHSQ